MAADVQRDPIESFNDAIRPAQLMVEVFRLLDTSGGPQTEHELMSMLRGALACTSAEELLLIENELFLGIIRERSPLKKKDLRTESLVHLLRQAVVASATAFETYLGNLVGAYLHQVIKLRQREFFPVGDRELQDAFKDLKFDLGEVVRLLNEDPSEIALFVGKKLEGHIRNKFLGSVLAVTVIGRLLGLSNPWENIAQHLQREPKELQKHVRMTLERRNDIVHRGDRSRERPELVQQMTFAYAHQSVSAVTYTCQALDELLKKRLAELRSAALQERA